MEKIDNPKDDKLENLSSHSETKSIQELRMEKFNTIFEKNKAYKKTSRYTNVIGIIAVTIGISASIFSIFKYSVSQKDTELTIEKNCTLIDSLSIKAEKVRIFINKEKIVKQVVSNFMDSIKTNASLISFYADTLNRYYLQSNVKKSEIDKFQKWHLSKYPRTKVIYDINSVVININKIDTTEIFLDVVYYSDSLSKPKNIIYQLKLNSDNKIFFLRNLIPQ